MSNNNKKIQQKMVRVSVLNDHGHDDYNLAVEEALVRVVKECFQHGRFPYVNTKPFQFSPEAETDKAVLLADTSRLRGMLNEPGDVVVRLTGDVVGG